jgi:hypothetical protein
MPQIAKRPFMAPHNGDVQRRRQELPKKFRRVGAPTCHMYTPRVQQSTLLIVKAWCTESDQNRIRPKAF